jgi:hypothetical protein
MHLVTPQLVAIGMPFLANVHRNLTRDVLKERYASLAAVSTVVKHAYQASDNQEGFAPYKRSILEHRNPEPFLENTSDFVGSFATQLTSVVLTLADAETVRLLSRLPELSSLKICDFVINAAILSILDDVNSVLREPGQLSAPSNEAFPSLRTFECSGILKAVAAMLAVWSPPELRALTLTSDSSDQGNAEWKTTYAFLSSCVWAPQLEVLQVQSPIKFVENTESEDSEQSELRSLVTNALLLQSFGNLRSFTAIGGCGLPTPHVLITLLKGSWLTLEKLSLQPPMSHVPSMNVLLEAIAAFPNLKQLSMPFDATQEIPPSVQGSQSMQRNYELELDVFESPVSKSNIDEVAAFLGFAFPRAERIHYARPQISRIAAHAEENAALDETEAGWRVVEKLLKRKAA